MSALWFKDFTKLKTIRYQILAIFLMLLLTGVLLKEQFYMAIFSIAVLTAFFTNLLREEREADELDFMFTLPITRKTYLAEKFILIFGAMLVNALLMFVLIEVYTLTGVTHLTPPEILLGILIGILLCSLLNGTIIPLSLKYSLRQVNVTIIIICVGLLIVGTAFNMFMNSTHEGVLAAISKWYHGPTVLSKSILLILLSILTIWVSYKSSVRMFNKIIGANK